MNKKIIKICIFDKMCTPTEVLNSNGDNILDNICTKCETYESLDSSGTYELDAIFNIDDNGLYNLIVDEAILKVTMDYGEEIFRIASLEKEMKEIIVFARQITVSETLDMWIEDIRPTDTNGIGALTTLKNNSIGKKDINVFSNITNISTAYYQRMNLHNAIHSCDQSFISRWGGEILRRKYNLSINTKVGSDRGVKIISGKNIIGFRAITNIDNVVTRIRAVGNDGITASNYIDSPLIDKYSAIKTKEIKYENVKVKDENNPDEGFDNLEQAQRELERLGELEFTENHIDELKAEYSINSIYLEKTEEYKNYVQAERVYLGDIVHVYEKNYDLEISVRVVSKRYDVLKQRVIEIELSNTDIKGKTITANDIISEIKSIINSSENNNVKDIIQSMINSGIKDSYIIPRQNEIIIADNKDMNKANYICRINKNGMAFSKSGYYGDYEYGFTIDGVINASLISTGILRTILIQNLDGSFEIDLSKPGGALFKNNGKDAIKIENNSLKLYNWAKEGDYIGALTSLVRQNDKTKPMIGLVNDTDSAISIGYQSIEKDGEEFKSYIELDKYGILGNLNPITFLQDIGLLGRVLNFGKNNEHSMYNSSSDNLCIAHKDRILFVDKDSGKVYFKMGNDEFTFYDAGGKPFFWKDKGRKNFSINGDLEINGEITGVVRNFSGDIIYDSNNPGGSGGTTEQNAIIESARKLIGKPYVWGGNYPPLGSSSGTDCSGLCQWAYNDNGISISRTTYTQINEGIEVTVNDLQPGDLVFSNFSSPGVPEHVYLYSGKNSNGELMCVEAPRTGLNIRERVFTWTSSMRARRILSTKALINENVELKNKILNLEERLSNLEKLYR